MPTGSWLAEPAQFFLHFQSNIGKHEANAKCESRAMVSPSELEKLFFFDFLPPRATRISRSPPILSRKFPFVSPNQII